MKTAALVALTAWVAYRLGQEIAEAHYVEAMGEMLDQGDGDFVETQRAVAQDQ